ncbi:class I SAM-dependent methyltransferase [Nocardioides sp. Bht2]|uniref:class I SAM-dependent methyltransferase n=1 Tax=Nocardioides sp. Bht2 TaxID=3392297 RepID=UPI0039B62DDC
MSSAQPRWFTDTEAGHSQRYVERFRTMAAEGKDLDGEARLIDALVPRNSRILDAGCGPGRVGGALHQRGHQVVGVDVDPILIAAAEEDHPGPRWLVADLATLDLGGIEGPEEPFDLVVVAGNVLLFVAPGTERKVLERLAAHVVPGGRIVIGFRRAEEYSYSRFDADITAAGLRLEQRFSTWDLEPFSRESEFAVSVLRVAS